MRAARKLGGGLKTRKQKSPISYAQKKRQPIKTKFHEVPAKNKTKEQTRKEENAKRK